MKSVLSALIVFLGITSFAQVADFKFTTHTADGQPIAVFTKVQDARMGVTWKDPSGKLWSTYQDDSDNIGTRPDQNDTVMRSHATEICAAINARLPTAAEFVQLATYFESDSYGRMTHQGRNDLFTILPDMQGRGFWSSTLVKEVSDNAVAFDGDTYSSVILYRGDSVGVRCVR